MSSPAISLSNVLLPDPLGATMPVSPASSDSDTSSRTTVSSGQANDRCEQVMNWPDMQGLSTCGNLSGSARLLRERQPCAPRKGTPHDKGRFRPHAAGPRGCAAVDPASSQS